MSIRARWDRLREGIRIGRHALAAWEGRQLAALEKWAKKDGPAYGTIALGMMGWLALTDVVVRLSPAHLAEVIHEASFGVLCLSLFGWRFAFTIARDGLYALSQRGKKP